jgi:hypothetical protein
MKTGKIIIIVLCLTANLSYGQWVSLGPFSQSGAINKIVADDIQNKLYCSSYDGGLWVFNNFTAPGTTNQWTPLTDQLQSLEVRSFAIAQNNTIYLASTDLFMVKSVNGGSTWTNCAYDKSFGLVNDIAAVYNQPNIVYVATKSGLWKSTDGGNSFPLKLLSGDVTDVEIDHDDPGYIYAGVRKTGLKRSIDAGTTWIDLKTWATAGATCGEYILISLGKKTAGGQAENKTNRTIATKMGNKVWVGRFNGTSHNFVDIGFSDVQGGSKNRTDNLVTCDWNNAIAISPQNSDIIFIGQEKFSVANRGATGTYSITQLYPLHEDQHGIACSSTTSNLLFVAHDGGVAKSTNNGSNFSSFTKGLQTYQITTLALNGTNLIASIDHNSIRGTTTITSGIWSTPHPSNCGYGNNALEFNPVLPDEKRPGRFYLFDDFKHLSRIRFPPVNGCSGGDMLEYGLFHPYFRSTASAIELDQFRDGIRFPVPCIAVDKRPNSDVILVAAAQDYPNGPPYTLMRTNQGNQEPIGNSSGTNPATNLPVWNTEISSMDETFNCVKFIGVSSKVYALTSKGSLYKRLFPTSGQLVLASDTVWRKSTSLTATDATLSLQNPIISFDYNRIVSTTLYAISHNSFFVSTNDGTSWTPRLRNIPVKTYYMVAAHPTNQSKVYLSTSNGVYVTTNSGQTWVKVGSNLPNVKVLQIYFHDNFLYAATYGRGLWRIPVSNL